MLQRVQDMGKLSAEKIHGRVLWRWKNGEFTTLHTHHRRAGP